MLRAAIQDPDPVVFYESINLYYRREFAQDMPEDLETIDLSRNVVAREGNDVSVITYGRMLPLSLQAADDLEKEGVSVEVVDMRVLRPLDLEPAVDSFKKTNRAVVATDEWRTAGMGGELAASLYELAFDYLDAPIKRVNALEVPNPYNRNLELAMMPDKEDIKKAILEVLE
jgi:pyruvate dehydrogenase E1 component beta subunit